MSPCCREQARDIRELRAAKGSPPCPALRAPSEVGDRTGAEALQRLTAQVRNRALAREGEREESGEVGHTVLSLHPWEGWQDPSQESPQRRDFLLGQRKQNHALGTGLPVEGGSVHGLRGGVWTVSDGGTRVEVVVGEAGSGTPEVLGWGAAGARPSWWPAEPQEESAVGTPNALAGASLGMQMGTVQVTACGSQGLGGKAGFLSLQAMLKWSRGRTPRSGKGTEPAKGILKLVLGPELCTHDSRFSRAGTTERCLQGPRGPSFIQPPSRLPLLLSV